MDAAQFKEYTDGMAIIETNRTLRRHHEQCIQVLIRQMTGRAWLASGPGLKTLNWLVASCAPKIKSRLLLGMQLAHCAGNWSATSLAFWPQMTILKIVLLCRGQM